MSGAWWDKFVDGLKLFFECLGSEQTRKTVEGILRLIILGCEIAERFNSPLTGEEKARFVRLLVRAVKYSSREQVQQVARLMCDLKASGDVDRLEAWELDKALGDGISLYMAGQVQAGGRGGAPEGMEY